MNRTIDAAAFRTTAHLPDHASVLRQTLDFFSHVPEVIGAIASGSTATGRMDEYSDLDLGFILRNEETRAQLWKQRWNWNIAPWFHRFDADHIKPYFVIYFFEPSVHVDICFYTPDDMPTALGAPFAKLWCDDGFVDQWLPKANSVSVITVDWTRVVHDDERFWAWMHYACTHAGRGEFYDVASFLKDLRRVVETWQAMLEGKTDFTTRRAEAVWSSNFIDQISNTFAQPNRVSIKAAFEALIKLQLEQRIEIDSVAKPKWKTKPEAIAKVTTMVNAL